MKQRILTWVSFVLLSILTFTNSARADGWVTLNPFGFEFFTTYNARITENDRGERSTRSVSDTGISFRQTGYFTDPGLARFRLVLAPTYTRAVLSADNQDSSVSDSNINYDISLSLMQEAAIPVSAILNAYRRAFTTNGTLGSYSRSRQEEQSVRIDWRNPYFRTTFRYREQSYKQFYISGLSDVSTSRDNFYRSFELVAKSTPMEISLVALNADDLISTTNNDFERYEGNIRHQFIWGRGSSLRSHFRYFDRTGFNAFEQSRLEEFLNIYHTDNIYSQTNLYFISTKQQTKTDSSLARFELFHSLYQNLNTSGYLYRNSVNSSSYDFQEDRVGLRTRYNKNDIAGFNVSANLGIFYGNTTNDSQSGLIEIVDEPHVVPLVGEILLNRRYIMLSTIVITNNSGTFVYIEGADYEVRPQPEGFTQISIIPGGQIQIDQTILVSYSAEALPSSEYSTLSTNIGFNIIYNGFQFSFYDNTSNYTLKSGPENRFLENRHDTIAKINYTRDFTRASGALDAEYRNTKAGGYSSHSIGFGQSLSYELSQRTELDFTMREIFSKWEDGQDEKAYSFGLLVRWRPAYGLTLEPELSAWHRKQTYPGVKSNTQQKEQYLTAGLNLRWVYRKIFVDLVLRHNRRGVNDSNTNYNIIYFNLRRTFR